MLEEADQRFHQDEPQADNYSDIEEAVDVEEQQAPRSPSPNMEPLDMSEQDHPDGPARKIRKIRRFTRDPLSSLSRMTVLPPPNRQVEDYNLYRTRLPCAPSTSMPGLMPGRPRPVMPPPLPPVPRLSIVPQPQPFEARHNFFLRNILNPAPLNPNLTVIDPARHRIQKSEQQRDIDLAAWMPNIRQAEPGLLNPGIVMATANPTTTELEFMALQFPPHQYVHMMEMWTLTEFSLMKVPNNHAFKQRKLQALVHKDFIKLYNLHRELLIVHFNMCQDMQDVLSDKFNRLNTRPYV